MRELAFALETAPARPAGAQVRGQPLALARVDLVLE
jgi:hypothetical protein